MRIESLRPTLRAPDARWTRRLAAFALMSAMAACTPGGSGPVASLSSSGFNAQGPTLAFDSIDGPPPVVFDRLVQSLNAEAQSRNMPVVSRQSSAYYRVRGYLSAQVRRGQTVIAWVWDVYDVNQERAARVSGEEPAGKAGGDAWANADEAIVRRIAQASMSGISGVMNTAPARQPPGPLEAEPPIASMAAPSAGPDSAAALGFASR
jgi:hypothetical protein